MKPKKVLVLGSGGIQIGQAGEFDYSGSQALKALKEEGIKTVLINPNIATIQTDEKIAGKVYFLPLEVKNIEDVIKKEKPECILLGFGGQTALNCGVELNEKGLLKKYNLKVLGTQVKSIKMAEDREKFKETIESAGLKVPKSGKANTIAEAKKIASKIGYPVIIRVAYTLGGKGSGVAKNQKELEKIARIGLAQSMIKQILVEEYLCKWKEIEYEVMRDKNDNCMIICNMENFDPMGIHTGDSIVVAPSQTLTNKEYHKLREISIKVIKLLEIIGECNIQFALDPKSEDYRIIEVNPRLSRSSALASKATGYPIAYVAAKLSLGYTLQEITNKVTEATCSFFEPSLDYVVVKMPRWDFQKFEGVSKLLGVQMKSIGEAMAIGKTFEEALQKAVRMIDKGYEGICDFEENSTKEKIKHEILNPTDMRLFYIAKAIEKGFNTKKITELSGIDEWFISKIQNIVQIKNEIKKYELNKEILLKAKKYGFSDKEISKLKKCSEEDIRKLRKKNDIIPFVKQIDTLAGEYPAKTNYLYLTYNGQEDDIEFKKKKKLIVLGSGVYRIGSSVEFDWCCVNTAWALKKKGIEEVIMINCNPETVSTDFDVLDKLYFEEISVERILDIYEKENPDGIIVSVGGQTPNNIAGELAKNKVKIIGTSFSSIDKAEDRNKFSEFLDQMEIGQPEWKKVKGEKETIEFCKKVCYPVIIRPSYVLSGTGMKIIENEKDMKKYFKKIIKANNFTVSKFIENAKEVDVDGIGYGSKVFIAGILEHIENAGTHSGDSTMVIPTVSLGYYEIKKIKNYTKKIVSNLMIKGPFNIQYLVKEGDVLVIECNLRASRSMPFVSKMIGVNLMELGVDSMLDERKTFPKITYKNYGVKSAQFSYFRLEGASPFSSVEMNSTGEVACFGKTFKEAFLNSLVAKGIKIPVKGDKVLVLVNKNSDCSEIIKKLAKKYRIMTNEDNENDVIKLIENQEIKLVINLLKNQKSKEFIITRKCIDMDIPLITNKELAKVFSEMVN